MGKHTILQIMIVQIIRDVWKSEGQIIWPLLYRTLDPSPLQVSMLEGSFTQYKMYIPLVITILVNLDL